MNNTGAFEKKLWGQISALLSGTLTNLLCDLLPASSYKVTINYHQHEVTFTRIGTWTALGLVLLLFLSLWVFIFFVVPRCLRLITRFTYPSIKKRSANDLLTVLDNVTRKTTELHSIFNLPENTPNKSELLKAHGRALLIIISLLYKEFLPSNIKQQKRVEQYFRSPKFAVLATTTEKISDYELTSDILLLESMVTQLKRCASKKDDLLIRDCKNAEEKLADLKKMKAVASLLKADGSAEVPKADQFLINAGTISE